jgi:hypothetical protein
LVSGLGALGTLGGLRGRVGCLFDLGVELQVELEHVAVGRGVGVFSCRRLAVALREQRHVQLSQASWGLDFGLFLNCRGSHPREKLHFLIHF